MHASNSVVPRYCELMSHMFSIHIFMRMDGRFREASTASLMIDMRAKSAISRSEPRTSPVHTHPDRLLAEPHAIRVAHSLNPLRKVRVIRRHDPDQS